jgi:hypothetical protein
MLNVHKLPSNGSQAKKRFQTRKRKVRGDHIQERPAHNPTASALDSNNA